ncbi:MAG: division/cell wall cluster transcriptional repressor MraZ [Clostridia bacterium]|nr:division/cell wall cluster transcriptional repressor MraZ [Clostridia bacterium]
MLEIMPCMGVYNYNMDGKNRVFVPAKHREALGSPLIVYPSIRSKSLKVCSLDEWRHITEKLSGLPVKEREPIMRFFNRMGDSLVPDAQGRVTLNSELVEYAGLSGTVVIVGCGQNAEIWSKENYEALTAAEDLDAMRAAAENADV